MNFIKEKDFSSGKLALFFSAPAIFVLCVTVLIPIIYAVYLSLHRYKLKRAKKPFIGFDNYEKILSSDKFWESLSTSLIFSVSAVAVIISVSFFLALLLSHLRKLTVDGKKFILFGQLPQQLYHHSLQYFGERVCNHSQKLPLEL